MLRRLRAAAADKVVGLVGLRPFTRELYHIFVDGWGAAYVDVDRTLRDIRRLGDAPWAEAWSRTADRYRDQAQALELQGRRESAAALYKRAALYYRIGDYAISVDTPLKRAVYGQCAAAYARFAALSEPPIERLALGGASGALTGYLHRPLRSGTVPAVIVVPGLASAKEQPDFQPEWLTRRGIAAFAIDMPGHGEAFAQTRLRLSDYRAVSDAFDVLAAHPAIDAERIAVLGTSLGGTAALRAAAEDPRLCAVVNISGFYEPRHWFAASAPFVETALQYVTGLQETAEVRALVQQFTMRGTIARITAPLLTVHGDCDAIIPVAEARAIHAEATEPKMLLVYPGGDHGLCNTPEARYEVLDWLSQQLLGEPASQPAALAG